MNAIDLVDGLVDGAAKEAREPVMVPREASRRGRIQDPSGVLANVSLLADCLQDLMQGLGLPGPAEPLAAAKAA